MKRILYLLILVSLTSVCIAQEKGDLLIISHPGYRIYLDNEFTGFTSEEQDGLYLTDIETGTHSIKVEKKGYRTREFEVVINASKITELEVDLEIIEALQPLKEGFYLGTFKEDLPVNPGVKQMRVYGGSNGIFGKPMKSTGVYFYFVIHESQNDSGTGEWGVLTVEVVKKYQIPNTVNRLVNKPKVNRQVREMYNNQLTYTITEGNILNVKAGDKELGFNATGRLENNGNLYITEIEIFELGQTIERSIDFEHNNFD